MNRRPLSREDLLQRFNEQLRFIQRSIDAYRQREELEESKRIATHLRVLFHDKRTNKALLRSLNAWDDLMLYDTGAGSIVVGAPTIIRGMVLLRESTNRTP